VAKAATSNPAAVSAARESAAASTAMDRAADKTAVFLDALSAKVVMTTSFCLLIRVRPDFSR
jgi:hypothetical protein